RADERRRAGEAEADRRDPQPAGAPRRAGGQALRQERAHRPDVHRGRPSRFREGARAAEGGRRALPRARRRACRDARARLLREAERRGVGPPHVQAPRPPPAAVRRVVRSSRHGPCRALAVKWTATYFVGFLLFIAGILLALGKTGVLDRIGFAWTAIGIVIAL